MTVRIAATAVAVLALFGAGCTADPNRCDPHTGGFIGGASGLMTGCYDQRLTQREQALSQTQALTQQLRQESAALEAEQARTSAQVADLRGELRSLSSQNRRLERQLAALKADTRAKQQAKAQLQAKLQQIDARIAQLQSGGGRSMSDADLAREIARLKAQRDELVSSMSSAFVVQ